MLYIRSIQNQIESWLGKKKIIIIYGARQVGKTTLAKNILTAYPNSRYFNCETLDNQAFLSEPNPSKIRTFLGDYKIVVLDEAQKIKNIGTILKVISDELPEIQIIATGSSSFDLANEVSEPLTGRSIIYTLYPLSFYEITTHLDKITAHSKLEDFLIFGTYPEIVNAVHENAKTLLNNLVANYLYQDILIFEKLKKSDLLIKLLQLLALQIGSEVNIHELALTLKTSSKTISHYLDLLEKNFVLFRLTAFSRNLRKEIAKSFKVYFFDLGIRNSLINNYNPLSLRPAQEIGALWENFCITERLKYNQAQVHLVNRYFWRTYDQKEIDYLEESSGTLKAFEFKWGNNKKIKKPVEFLHTYPNSDFTVINRDNYLEFLG